MSKVGRNDPCPCGSGKKYKQCCWQKRLPLGKRSFKATVLKSGPSPKQMPDLMERTFGTAIREGEAAGLPELVSEIFPKLGEMPQIDAKGSLKEYLKESKARKEKERENSA